MAQQDVYDFLKKNKGKWFTAREVSDMTGLSYGSATMSLKRLRETDFVDFTHKNTNQGHHPYIYKFK